MTAGLEFKLVLAVAEVLDDTRCHGQYLRSYVRDCSSVRRRGAKFVMRWCGRRLPLRPLTANPCRDLHHRSSNATATVTRAALSRGDVHSHRERYNTHLTRRNMHTFAQSYIPSSSQDHLNTAHHNKDRHCSKVSSDPIRNRRRVGLALWRQSCQSL